MERETLLEVVVALGGAVLFIVIALVAGLMSDGGASLSNAGAEALVAGIVLFVLVMSGAGFWLAGQR